MSNSFIQIEPFKFIGISIQTTNKNNQSASDLGQLWQRFYSEQIADKIKDIAGPDIYTIYTDYESDYTDRYTAMIGFKVNSISKIPEGLEGREFTGGKFVRYLAKGLMPDAVINTWQRIWSDEHDLKRKYDIDFEVYSEKSKNQGDGEVQIFISVN